MPTCPGCHGQFTHTEYRVHTFRCSFLRGRQTGQGQPGYLMGGSGGNATEPTIEELLDAHEHRIDELEERLAEFQDDAEDVDAGDASDGKPR